MAFAGNPNSSIFGRNPFKTTNTGFTPSDMGGTRFSGLNAPQGGGRPTNSDTGGIKFPQVGIMNNDSVSTGSNSGFGLGGAIDELIGQMPNQTLPFVPPSQVPQIEGFQQTLQAIQQFGQPLLQGLLADLSNRFGMAQQAFGPEMELRQQMLGLLEGRDNRLLEELIAAQEEIAAARENMRPRSGGAFFKGF